MGLNIQNKELSKVKLLDFHSTIYSYFKMAYLMLDDSPKQGMFWRVCMIVLKERDKQAIRDLDEQYFFF